MARFVHLADGRDSRSIKRNGLKGARYGDGRRGVFCVPVVPDHARTFQWVREIRRWKAHTAVAVFFVLPDDEPVLVGHYNAKKTEMTAAQAHALFRAADDASGYEVLTQRSIAASEIRAIGPAPRIAGWRYFPGAKGRRPYWPQPGTWGAARSRRAIERWHESFDP